MAIMILSTITKKFLHQYHGWERISCCHRCPVVTYKSRSRGLSEGQNKRRLANTTTSSSSSKTSPTATATTATTATTKVTQKNNDKIQNIAQSLSSVTKVNNTWNSGQNDTFFSTSLSNAGLIIMGIAYMNNDMENFRLAAVGSLTMSMIAQYQLKESYLFRWNALFWGINVAWILIAKSNLDGQEKWTEDLKEVSNLLLRDQGNFLSQKQVRELFRRGQKETWNRGDIIAASKAEGFPCKELFFIESGTGVIVKQGYVMGVVQSGEFVVQHNDGNIKNWASSSSTSVTNDKNSSDCIQTSINDDDDHDAKDKDASFLEQESNPTFLYTCTENQTLNNHPCQESIVVDSESMTIWTWDQEEVKALDQTVKNALLAYMYTGTQERLRQAWMKSIRDDEEMARLQHIATEYLLDGVMIPKTQVSKP